MTTILGLKADKGKKQDQGVVLASDMTSTINYHQDTGEIIIKKQVQSKNQKIFIDEKKNFAVTMYGTRDIHYLNFLSDLLRGGIDLKRRLEQGVFRELAEINLKREGYKNLGQQPNGLLIATRYDKTPKLFSCQEGGKIEEITGMGLVMGSGQEFASKAISKKIGEFNPYVGPGITMNKAIRASYAAIEQSSEEDVYTGGMDIKIITPSGIKSYGEKINITINNAKKAVLTEILKEFK